MFAGRFVWHVMGKVRTIPKDDILIINGFTINPSIQPCLIRWTDSDDSVINLSSVVTQNPNVAFSEWRIGRTRCFAVVRPRNNFITRMSTRIFDSPFAFSCRVSRATDFKFFIVPVGGTDQRWIVEFADSIIPWSDNVKIKTPIAVMVMDIADARATHSRKTEARSNGPVRVEAPDADVPIPTCLHLTYEDYLLSLDVNAGAEKIAGV